MVQQYVMVVRQAQAPGDVRTHFYTATRRTRFERELYHCRIPYAGATDVLLHAMAVTSSASCIVPETPV